jgi:hypothetical protein
VGDSDRFDRFVASLAGPIVVVLQSPGGIVIDGLDIGLTIRRRNYGTAVPDGAACASVCGLIWLAGSPRLLAASSKIGFHAAHREDGSESGQANALVGAYLSRLGLSYRAIAFVTERGSDGMNWLHPSDAAGIGIRYTLITPPKPETFMPPPPLDPQYQLAPQSLPPAAPVASPAAPQARRLVLAYYALWSQGGGNVDTLAGYYAYTVSFYGTQIPREKLMEEKRKFAARWPIRQFTVNADSLFIQCQEDACSVTGIVAWDCSSQERGVHSIGSANLAVRLVNGVIVSENGSVLTSHSDSLEQQQAMTPAYVQGRQARFEYEAWFASLPDGPYKEGVMFWAMHRGDKPRPPPCAGSPDWLAGCLALRTRLAPIDVRRTSEKDYWWGWNSL